MTIGNRAGKKLHSRAGESIAETLIALLISALALVMLAGAITSAAKIIRRSDEVMDAYYQGLSGMGNPAKDGLILGSTLKIEDEAHNSVGFGTGLKLKYAVNGAIANTPVVAYSTTKETGGATP